jgi:UDP-glucose 4-epimerase
MRVLVTGGAGYIGSITTRALIDAGHEVVVLDSLERGHRAAVDRRATLIIASVGDADALDAVLPLIDAVVHMAGYIEVAESQEKPDLYYEKNVTEPAVMLERMAAHGVRYLVFSSTAAVYGEPETVPITEDALCAPVNAYGATKLAFEDEIASAEESGALRAVRLRYFNVAGAWPDGSLGEAHDPETHIVPRLLAAAAKRDGRFTVFGDDYPTPDGTCVRDYIHVVDLAAAHLAAVEYLATGGAGLVCNLGSGHGYSNLEVTRACMAVVGREIPVDVGPRRPGDPAVLIASNDRAREVLGWEPERGLDAMVADAWRWHSAHPQGYAE